eukprot:gene23897-30175_t
MVRISSQATILNVYKVDDSRAREYALQEEVMHSLFVNVVKLMQNQHSTISGICVAYFTESCSGNDETKLNRLENQLEDILASTEDWFYYLQDILDLKILVLRQALIHHLINEFVYPCLLQPLLQYRASASAAERESRDDKVGTGSPSKSSGGGASSQFTSDLVMRTMEIEFCGDEEVSLSAAANTSNSSTGHSKSLLANLMRSSASSDLELQSRALTMNSAMVYMLQMLRFITDPLLQRAVLVTLYHPLNQSARTSLIVAKTPFLETASPEIPPTAGESGEGETQTEVAAPTNDIVIVNSPSSITEEDVNPFGDTLKRIAATGAPGSSNQKLVLTSVFMFHLLCTGLIAGNPSRTVEGETYFATDLLSALQMVRLLQCMDILPSGGDCSCLAEEEVVVESSGALAVTDASNDNGSDSAAASRGGTKNDRHKHHRNSRKAPYSAIPQHSYDADPDLLSLNSLRKIRLLSGIGDANSGEQGSSQRPLLAVYMDVLRYPGNHSLTAFQVTAHCVFAIANLVHDAFASGSPASQRDSGTPLLTWLLRELKSAVKYAALTLLARTDGPQSEVLLNLVREEMRRYEGKKWKTVAFRMYGDILLFLPATNTNMRRLGIDFDIPISQAESIRKDIQCFLILRALYTHVVALSQFSKDTTHTADLCSAIKDATFLSLDEANVLPPHIADGLSYDMRGKRFLDSVLIHSGATQLQLASDKSSSESSSLSSGGSSLASILSLGYLGGSRRSSTGSSSGGSATPPRTSKRHSANITSGGDTKGGVVVVAGAHQNILFIQEPTILLLISQDKTHTKIGFKVFAAVPLLYTDAKIDPEDRKRFKVLVRSWKPLPQMCRVEPEGVSTCDDADATAPGSGAGAQQSQHRTRRGWQTESYRKASERSTFWSLTLAMETEQACMLAVQHIENKRQELFAQKMTRLKGMLRCWASDTPADENAAVISQSA